MSNYKPCAWGEPTPNYIQKSTNQDAHRKQKLHLKPNVIDGQELRDLFESVFDDMAKYVSRTYGPYGENTCYQLRDKILMTKDGWTVEQEFTYSKNLLANIVRKLIINVSNSVYLHAGDGTSTGLLVANAINAKLMEYKDHRKIHSKTLTTAIEYCVHYICKELAGQATIVTDENMTKIIHQIALVSLDWDIQLADFIRDIYEKTKNPFIHVKESGQTNSYVSFISGYDLSGRLVSEFKINDTAQRQYKVEQPAIMVFSHSLPKELFNGLVCYCTQITNISDCIKEFVIMAPNFDKGFRDNYTALCNKCIRINQKLPSMTLVQYDVNFNIDREMLSDFCLLTGSSLISNDNIEYENTIRSCEEIWNMMGSGTPEEKMVEFTQSILAKLESFDISIGCCEQLTVNNKSIIASGFGDYETCDEVNRRIHLLESEIEEKRRDFDAKSMYADDIRIKIARLSKLKLKSGIINVGGFGEDNIKSTKDALDDAINACKVAYTDGVVVGGNIAPICAIDNILTKINESKNLIGASSLGDANDITLIKDILCIIRDGYIETTKIMYKNKYNNMGYQESDVPIKLTQNQVDEIYKMTGTDDTDDASASQLTLDQLIQYCVANRTAWNLITDSLDSNIIHPVTVEMEIIKGVLHLVLTTTTTNQLFYHGYEGIDKELEDMREVPVDGMTDQSWADRPLMVPSRH